MPFCLRAFFLVFFFGSPPSFLVGQKKRWIETSNNLECHPRYCSSQATPCVINHGKVEGEELQKSGILSAQLLFATYKSCLGGGFRYFLFLPLGRWSNLTCSSFSDGWLNHQLYDMILQVGLFFWKNTCLGQLMVHWWFGAGWFGFLGSLGVPRFESQTTGPQTTN